ncbi:MAG: hypothetical protein RLY20_116 [Verrucomicrobiota bacterium]|jgi:hypothetical protein
MFNRSECKKRRDGSRVAFSLVLLLILSLHCFAHDPLEITSTIRLETNRTAVEIEMEFNTAILLVGAPRARDEAEQTALFQSLLPRLRQEAGRFFELGSGPGTFIATTTNVTLGAEDHVKFNLEFPSTHDGLRLNASAVKSLGQHGPYGVGVTVLDMVNLKVLGQSVLFSNTPSAEFGPLLEKRSVTNLAPTNTASPRSPTVAAAKSGPVAKSVAWLWQVIGVVLMLLAAAGWWLRRRRN